eukprot:TRINITY_DN6920_c1_g2_i1.p1 TRINITY_DN6920_c1_g2~~TRINITY_DN6920_c1_g2_i1.p1  ORF type:complete len:101 (+),score=9.83 TRINITY_DN6920_c1_g2_i1:48-350(+)
MSSRLLLLLLLLAGTAAATVISCCFFCKTKQVPSTRSSLSAAAYSNQRAVAVGAMVTKCPLIAWAMTIFCRKVQTCLELSVSLMFSSSMIYLQQGSANQP